MKNSGLKQMGLIILLVVLLVGCTSKKDAENTNTASTKPAATEPGATAAPISTVAPKATTAGKDGGELTFALAGDPTSFDVNVIAGDASFRVGRSIFDSLVTELPDHTIKPWLAESWEISADLKSYTFKLRKDVKFHDGTPFNAAAVKFNIDRILNPDSKSIFAKQLLGPITSSEAVDEFTVKLILSDAYVPLLGNLAKSTLGIESPAAIAKYGDKVGLNPVGTGPFKLLEYVPNSQLVLEKNPDYNWAPEGAGHTGPAYLNKVIYKFIPEEATRVGSLQSKQVLAAESIPAQNLVSLQKDSNFQVLQALAPGGTFALVFNNEKAPWNDVKLRQAFQAAVDVDSIVKTLYLGIYPRAWSPLSPTTFAYDATLENSYKVDLDKANKLLDDAGWKLGADGIRVKDGKPLKLVYSEVTGNREKRQDIVTIIQQQVKKIGVKMELSVTAVGPYLASLTGGTYDLAGESFAAGDPDVLRTLFSAKNIATKEYASSNMARFNNPDVEQLLQAGFKEGDNAKRADIYKKVQQYIVTNANTIPIYVFPYSVATTKEVKGITFENPSYPVLYNAYIEH